MDGSFNNFLIPLNPYRSYFDLASYQRIQADGIRDQTHGLVNVLVSSTVLLNWNLKKRKEKKRKKGKKEKTFKI